EISSIITAAKRRNVLNVHAASLRYPRPAKGGPVKKIKKNIYLQPDSVYERSEFEPHETEEERIMVMTESLCHAVRKYDHYEWCNRYTDDRIRPENVAARFVSNLLNNRCADVAARLRQCEQFPPDLTLPPTFSTAAAYRVFESSRVSLSKRASEHFNPSDVTASDLMVLYPEGDLVRKFTVHDRLNIQLHSDILSDMNYLKLKTQVRAVFLEPTRLAMAIESPEEEEIRNKTQMELMQVIMAEQEAAQNETMVNILSLSGTSVFNELLFNTQYTQLDHVAHEVVVGNAQENEPIYYEDAVDDALNATVRAGERTETMVAGYEKLERELNEYRAPTRHQPRSTRNRDSLAVDLPSPSVSDEDDNLEIDVVGPSSTSARRLGDSTTPSMETGPSEMHEHLKNISVKDVLVACGRTDDLRSLVELNPVKRKRGRPRKYEGWPPFKANQDLAAAPKRKRSAPVESDESEEI
ncbi:hypothetical protein OSTOST_03920, partial [Ostertagia ostertagi]